MNKQTKIEIINDKINQLNIHIDLLNQNIANGNYNKQGFPSFEEILLDFSNAKQALIQKLDELN